MRHPSLVGPLERQWRQCQSSSGSRGAASSTGPGWLGGELCTVAPHTAQCPSKDPAYITRSDQSRLKKSPGRFSLIGRQELFEDAWPTSVAPCKEVEPARHRPLVILVQLEQVDQPTHWPDGGQETWPSQQPLFTGSNLFYKLLSTYTLRPKMKREKTFEQWQDHLEGNE